MYSKLKSSVKHDGNFLDFFSCNIGLVQEESLSPFLYAMYVNDIEIELIKQGCQSYELKMLNLYLLMYADDTVLFSENVHELQNMINVVNVCPFVFLNQFDLNLFMITENSSIFRLLTKESMLLTSATFLIEKRS